MELYFYNECGFSQSVLNCMTNLHCEDKITRKNIRENPDYETELIALTGAKTVPVLVIDGKTDERLRGDQSISCREVHVAEFDFAMEVKKGRRQSPSLFLCTSKNGKTQFRRTSCSFGSMRGECL